MFLFLFMFVDGYDEYGYMICDGWKIEYLFTFLVMSLDFCNSIPWLFSISYTVS